MTLRQIITLSRIRPENIPSDERLAFRVLGVFQGRNGFDLWFDAISDERQDEVFEELKRVLSSDDIRPVMKQPATTVAAGGVK
jgi:hypothetical protein